MTETSNTTADPLDGVNPQHILAITHWATRHGATPTFNGTCGFARPCVGVTIGGNYLDYSHLYDLDPAPDPWLWTPEDAYHKHDCMAVLGHGPAAVAQLHEWVTWLDEHGWTVSEEYRNPKDALDAVFHGLSTPKLMPPVPGSYPHEDGA